ncbi:MAG: hypothetical protein IPK79_09015 [Vampirovibrionales bacterium]|nr:hypothetical protein [Vampirovibrionales bacterium]
MPLLSFNQPAEYSYRPIAQPPVFRAFQHNSSVTPSFSQDVFQKEEKFLTDNNPLRMGLTRYLGYTNEFGVALEPLIGEALKNLTFKVVELYALTDAFLTGFRAYNKAIKSGMSQKDATFDGLVMGGEAGIFQGIASYFVPALIVDFVKRQTENILKPTGLLNATAKNWPRIAKALPMATGIAVIPLIVSPIDKMAEWIIEKIYHPFVNSFVRPRV